MSRAMVAWDVVGWRLAGLERSGAGMSIIRERRGRLAAELRVVWVLVPWVSLGANERATGDDLSMFEG